MDFHSNFFPDFSKFDNLVLAASIFLFYAGMEMGGIHVKDVDNPSKNYPKAVFIGALITVVIFVLGTFALGIIIPEKDLMVIPNYRYRFGIWRISRSIDMGRWSFQRYIRSW